MQYRAVSTIALLSLPSAGIEDRNFCGIKVIRCDAAQKTDGTRPHSVTM